MSIGIRVGGFDPFGSLDYVPPGQDSHQDGTAFYSFSKERNHISKPLGEPNCESVPNPMSSSFSASPISTPIATPLRFNSVSGDYLYKPESDLPSRIGSYYQNSTRKSRFGWERSEAGGKTDQFIPATVVLDVKTGPKYTFSTGTEIKINQSFLGTLENSIVTLKPGDISFEYEGERFHGMLSQIPSGQYIIGGPGVDISTLSHGWIDVVDGPDGKHFLADWKVKEVKDGMNVQEQLRLGIGGDIMPSLNGKFISGTVQINKNGLHRGLQVKVGKTTWGEYIGQIGATFGW
ncbi:hypothetical protein TSTA_108030 [Talaromyces stipitatus ATCC 10500]|uniref:Uncharacterized protein n=1 Tax=Talaromyces stipitatus (strain ATCC 10500 / CBS 375.48 / QM 6759 / NRRL 1006) TaxID=441959 RepID=B8MUA9_TALSN|nr:uncharacterized protein TSTA_108030 [Talaromyces stipitatus ATCC 10500]EED11613.1 hypothetical protein TSTA_108030 [Talaromyces stipitatus ATCC 10500]